MAEISPNPSQSQRKPTRMFQLHPVKSLEDYFRYRELAYGNIVGKIKEAGQTVNNYDVRPASPADDFASITTNNYQPDWSLLSSVITVTDGKIGGTGNTVLSGSMPTNRFLLLYGTSIQTQGTAPEVAWVYKSGANVKNIFQLDELFGFEHPRALAELMPAWGSDDAITHNVVAVSAAAVWDVPYSYWGEVTGTTITASNTRA